MNNIKHFPQRTVRQDHWGDYEWRDTIQKQPPVPFESIAQQRQHAQSIRRLFVWVCVSFTLFCLALAGVAFAVVATS